MLQIDELEISNLLSFGNVPVKLPLNRLNVLIGTNGAGKSNFIEILGLLKSTLNDYQREMSLRGGLSEWYWKGAGRIPSAWIEAKFSDPEINTQFTHKLSLSFYRGDISHVELVDEKIRCLMNEEEVFSCQWGGHNGALRINRGGVVTENDARRLNPSKSLIAQLQDPITYPELSLLAEFYASCRIFQEWHIGPDSPIRRPQRTDARKDRMEQDFSNAAIMLNRIRQNPEAKAKLIGAFQEIYDGVDDIDVAVDGGTMSIRVQEGKYSFAAARLSDGTLRYLCLLLILLDPHPPGLICIEEPEVGLHPDIIARIAALLLDASSRTQLVVTTHSDILIDELTESPENVIVCEKTGNKTSMVRLEPAALFEWLKDYTLGPLWTRGFLGGNRW